jgi:hypothetical protein
MEGHAHDAEIGQESPNLTALTAVYGDMKSISAFPSGTESV